MLGWGSAGAPNRARVADRVGERDEAVAGLHPGLLEAEARRDLVNNLRRMCRWGEDCAVGNAALRSGSDKERTRTELRPERTSVKRMPCWTDAVGKVSLRREGFRGRRQVRKRGSSDEPGQARAFAAMRAHCTQSARRDARERTRWALRPDGLSPPTRERACVPEEPMISRAAHVPALLIAHRSQPRHRRSAVERASAWGMHGGVLLTIRARCSSQPTHLPPRALRTLFCRQAACSQAWNRLCLSTTYPGSGRSRRDRSSTD